MQNVQFKQVRNGRILLSFKTHIFRHAVVSVDGSHLAAGAPPSASSAVERVRIQGWFSTPFSVHLYGNSPVVRARTTSKPTPVLRFAWDFELAVPFHTSNSLYSSECPRLYPSNPPALGHRPPVNCWRPGRMWMQIRLRLHIPTLWYRSPINRQTLIDPNPPPIRRVEMIKGMSEAVVAQRPGRALPRKAAASFS